MTEEKETYEPEIGPPEGMELNVGDIKITLDGLDEFKLPPINSKVTDELVLTDPIQINLDGFELSTKIDFQEVVQVAQTQEPCLKPNPVSQFYEPQLNLEGFEDLDELQTQKTSAEDQNSTNLQGNLKHSKSMAPSVLNRIHSMNSTLAKEFNTHVNSMRIQELDQEVKILRTINADQQKEIALLRQFIKANFKSPELCGRVSDLKTQAALEKCFLDKPLVIMTYASPLVRIKYTEKERQLIEMDLLDYQKEFSCAIGGLKKTGNAVAVKRVHGTFERFQHVMSDHPVGMHFTGHGIINSFAAIGQDNIILQNQGNCLVFETNDGLAHYITQEKLKEVVSSTSLQFVFIASCHSQFAGEIFHNAGAEHVICVQQSREILDEAAIIFSQNFYELLFKETLTVCQAFFEAKKMLESHPDPAIRAEAVNLIIFKRKQDGRRHECKILGPYPTGQVELVRRQPYFQCDVARVDEFVGRQLDMQQILVCILNNRLTTLKGVPGIGKTTISRSVSWFLAERDIFDDGIIFVSMRGRDQTSQLIQQIFQNISHQSVYSATQKVDNAFMYERVFYHLKDRCVLLVIDNLEDVLRNDRDNSRNFLETLLQRNAQLKILATSREIIQDLGEITERVYEIKELSNNYTLQLLEKKALRHFDSGEIKELLELKLSNKLSLSIGKAETDIKIKRLEDHHLCDLLAGHPMTVSLWAPLLQNSSLSQLYQKMLRMMQSKNFIRDTHELNPVNSLKVSMDASVQYVRSTQPQAIDLFCLLGMMPGGATQKDLTQLWEQMPGRDREWEFLTQILKKYSLLVDKIELATSKVKYQLLGPFMNKYAESLLTRFQLREMQDLIIDYFVKLLRPMYLDCNVESKRSTHDEQIKIRNQQQEMETNFWACMYRICVGIDPDEPAKKHGKHKHLTVGYSSADEFESILIGEMTTDNEEEDHDSSLRSSFPNNRRTLTPIVRSASENSSNNLQDSQSTTKLTKIQELDEGSYLADTQEEVKAVKFEEDKYDSDDSECVEEEGEWDVTDVDQAAQQTQTASDTDQNAEAKLENLQDLSQTLKRRGLLSFPSKQQSPTRGSSKMGGLATIPEAEDYLTTEGLFIVLFVSVNVLINQTSQASRIVHVYCKSTFNDPMCRANLVKLQGLIYFNERKYQQALQTFEQAQMLFQKKSKLSVGAALCLAAQAMILYSKTVHLEIDESKAFSDALEKFTKALQLYRDNKHIPGQAFCTKQMGHLKKKMFVPLKQYQYHFDEAMRLVQQRSKLIQEGKWIERYTGQENSLFIEIIGEKPASQSLVVRKSAVRATESKKWDVKPSLKISAAKTTVASEKPSPRSSTSRESSYASDEDQLNLKITKIRQQRNRRDSMQAGLEMARKKFEQKQQTQTAPSVFKNVANRKQTIDEVQKLKAEDGLLTNILQVQELPETLKFTQSLPYSWAWKIDNTDPLYFKRQEKSLNWFFFDFEQCWQIEQFFRRLTEDPQCMRTDALHLVAKQIHKEVAKQYHIYQDPSKRRLIADGQNSTLVQKNLKTKVTRTICRFDTRKCVNNLMQKPQAKANMITKLQQVCQSSQEAQEFVSQQVEKTEIKSGYKQEWEGYMVLDSGLQQPIVCTDIDIRQNQIYGVGKVDQQSFSLSGSLFKSKAFVMKMDFNKWSYTLEGAFSDATFSQMDGVWHTESAAGESQNFEEERKFHLKQTKKLQDLTVEQLNQIYLAWIQQCSTPQEAPSQESGEQRTSGKQSVKKPPVKKLSAQAKELLQYREEDSISVADSDFSEFKSKLPTISGAKLSQKKK